MDYNVIRHDDTVFQIDIGNNSYRFYGKLYEKNDSIKPFLNECFFLEDIMKPFIGLMYIDYSLRMAESSDEGEIEVHSYSGIGKDLCQKITNALAKKLGVKAEEPDQFLDEIYFQVIYDQLRFNIIMKSCCIKPCYVEYSDYLQSPEWITIRNKALKIAGYECSRCGTNTNLHVHHLNYSTIGKESQADLFVVCSDCHESFHS